MPKKPISAASIKLPSSVKAVAIYPKKSPFKTIGIRLTKEEAKTLGVMLIHTGLIDGIEFVDLTGHREKDRITVIGRYE